MFVFVYAVTLYIEAGTTVTTCWPRVS